MKRLILLNIFCCVVTISAFAQSLGGSNTYAFLDIVNTARVAALGGTALPIADKDPNLTLDNASVLNADHDGAITLGYVDYLSDISYGYTSFSKDFKDIGTFMASLQFAQYGSIIRTDAAGNKLGTVPSSDFSFGISYGREIDTNLSIGGKLSFHSSSYDVYSSSGLALDVSAIYQFKKSGINISAIMRNMGFQLSTYNGENESLPFRADIGISYKLKYAPIRFMLVYENLQTFNLSFIDPTIPLEFDPNTFEAIPASEASTPEKFLQHLVFGTEFNFSESFFIQFGYNYRRRQELKFHTRQGLAGISFGAGLRINRFKISYAYSRYNLAGISNHISVATNIHSFRSK